MSQPVLLLAGMAFVDWYRIYLGSHVRDALDQIFLFHELGDLCKQTRDAFALLDGVSIQGNRALRVE